MAEFTYKLPEDKDFYLAVEAIASSDKNENVLEKILRNGRCELYATSSYSQKRWNAYWTEVHFYVPIDIFSEYSKKIQTIETALLKICQQVMPPSAGYDVSKVSVSPIISSNTNDTLEEIKDIVSKGNYLSISDDLVEKGKKMANAYITLYALENHIRKYINTKLTEKIGNDYMESIIIPKKVKTGIETRKSQEQSKKWLPLRGDNDLYYADFIELADIITNNWDYFKDDISDQEWIKVKMQEMYAIRCLIAHNSYISDDNIQLLELTTKQIISQLYS